MEAQPKWDLWRAVKNSFKWDSQDWYYLLLTIIILTGAWLYYMETNTCQTTLNHINDTCALYCSLQYAHLQPYDNLSFNIADSFNKSTDE